LAYAAAEEINRPDPRLGNTVLHEASLNCKSEVVARMVIKLLEVNHFNLSVYPAVKQRHP
jgi:hypothetical protein